MYLHTYQLNFLKSTFSKGYQYNDLIDDKLITCYCDVKLMYNDEKKKENVAIKVYIPTIFFI